MHRTNSVPRTMFWGGLLGLVLSGVLVACAQAQEGAPPAQAEQPPAPKNGAPPPPEGPGLLVIPLGGSRPLQFIGPDKKPHVIKAAILQNETIARVLADPLNPTRVIILGLQRGRTTITLTDVDGKAQVTDIAVEFDIELLRRTIRRIAPTSNVEPILIGGNTLILTGTVERPEDIEIILRTAQTLIGVVTAVPTVPVQGAPPPGSAPEGGPPPTEGQPREGRDATGGHWVTAGPFVTGGAVGPSLVAGGPQVINAMRVGGVPQVQLCVVVARVARTELRRMSFDFINDGVHHVFASTVGGGFVIPSTGISGTFPGGPTITNMVGSPNQTPANFFLALFNPEQDFFGLLQALRSESLAKILTEPKLVTLSGRPATLLSGGQQAIPQPGGLGTISVTYKDFGTQLNFLPVVLGNGKIHLEVEPEVSTLDAAFGTSIQGTTVPGFALQRVHTTVELEDGQTFAIGGLIERLVTADTTKVPILGDLPFLGAAFSTKSFSEEEDELVVLVTAHLIDPMSCDQVPKVLPGEETRTPDDFEFFLEGILEAPRGPREVCPNKHYVPAFKNGPTAVKYPCAGGRGGCASGSCGAGVPAAVPPPGANGGSMPAEVPTGVPPAGERMPRISLGAPAAPLAPELQPVVAVGDDSAAPSPPVAPPAPLGSGDSGGSP
jgi:pilus assembly protein CpaC